MISPPVTVPLEPEVVHEQVAVDRPGERDERSGHLFGGPDGVDEVEPLVEADIGGEDIVLHIADIACFRGRPDIGAEDTGPGITDDPGGVKVPSGPDLGHVPVT